MLRNMTSIYIISNNKILLLYRIGSKVVEPSWCGIGGHFEENELNNPKACVLRELYEETGISEYDIKDIRLRYITLRLKNGEVRQNYFFFCYLDNKNIDITKCNEGTLEWVNMDKVLERKMPCSAKNCLRHYLTIGKENDIMYGVVSNQEGADFLELKEF